MQITMPEGQSVVEAYSIEVMAPDRIWGSALTQALMNVPASIKFDGPHRHAFKALVNSSAAWSPFNIRTLSSRTDAMDVMTVLAEYNPGVEFRVRYLKATFVAEIEFSSDNTQKAIEHKT